MNGEVIAVEWAIGVGREKGEAENEHDAPSKHSIQFNANQSSLTHSRPFDDPVVCFLECYSGHYRFNSRFRVQAGSSVHAEHPDYLAERTGYGASFLGKTRHSP